MKKFNKLSYFLSGVLCATLVLSLASPAFAEGVQKTISIATGVSIFVDDVKLNPTDGNGKPVEAFIYDGTTYLPVRAVSQALGKNVFWDGATGSVFLGQHKADGRPACSLDKLDYFTSQGVSVSSTVTNIKDNLSETHSAMQFQVWYGSAISDDAEVVYKTNGKYSALSGTLFLEFGNRSTKSVQTVKIYGDDRILWTGTMTGGVEPIDFNVDLTGVQELTLTFSVAQGDAFNIYIGDTMLYT